MITIAQQLAFAGWIEGADEPTTSDDWYTPPELVALIEDFYGGEIDLDPCWSPRSAVKPRAGYTIHDDGLALPWVGVIDGLAPGDRVDVQNRFLNVPYSRPRPWLERLAGLHASRRDAGESIALVKADPSTRAWGSVWAANAVLFCRRRIPYVHPSHVQRHVAPFPSALVYFGKHAEAFAGFFEPLGPSVQCIGGES